MGTLVQAMSIYRLADTHVLCRAYGHTWNPVNVTRTLNSRGRPIEYRAHLHCSRCLSNRTQRLDGSGGIVGNTYRYAEGYVKRPDEERITRADARYEYLERLSDQLEITDVEEQA